MSCNDMHVGDYGTAIRITVLNADGTVQDISAATSFSFTITKPTGVSFSVTPTLYTDGTDGILQYITVDGDIDEAGTWQIQAIITYISSRFSTTITQFKVLRNL